MGKEGCWQYCGYTGRRKPGAHNYNYTLFPPADINDPGSNQLPWDVWQDPIQPAENEDRYVRNLEKLCAASPEQYETVRRDTGIVKPTLFSALTCIVGIPSLFPPDLMHWAMNFAALFIDLWTVKMKCDKDDDKAKWTWVFLVDELFKKHGQAIVDAFSYLPGSFKHPPRGPYKKLNSGYKAWEFLTWLWGMAPALLYSVMPDPFYPHFCKAAAAIRILHQQGATMQDMLRAYQLLNEVCKEFKCLYVDHMSVRMHFVCHAIHLATHMVHTAIRQGMGSYLLQWVCERSIGIFGSLVRQPSNPYKNLSAQAILVAQLNALYTRAPNLKVLPPALKTLKIAINLGGNYTLLHPCQHTPYILPPEQRAAVAAFMRRAGHIMHQGWEGRVRRYGRLRLPNDQTARCAWRETLKPLHKLRISRNVKIAYGEDTVAFGEVLYYFPLEVGNTTHHLAMLHMYDAPDSAIMEETFGTYYSCEHKPILEDGGLLVVDCSKLQSVVAMIPHRSQWHLLEKITLGAGSLMDRITDLDDEPEEVD